MADQDYLSAEKEQHEADSTTPSPSTRSQTAAEPDKDIEALPPPAAKTTNADPSAVDWDGPDDPENPRNWSMGRKAYTSSVPALICLMVTFGSSVYSPGYPDVMETFNVSGTVALLPLAVYVYGLGFGPVLGAPISETFGRQVVYLTTVPLSLVFTLGAGFAQSFATLVVCRFLAGAFGSPSLAVGAGTNLDIWEPRHRGAAVGIFLLAPFLGPALGPSVGGFAAEFKGWRWTQWPILFLGVAVWIYSVFSKETYAKVILNRKAKKLGVARQGPSMWETVRSTMSLTIIRPMHMLFAEPIVALYSIYTAFNFSVLFCFFAAFPIVFKGVYGFSTGLSGLTFLALSVGCGSATAIFIVVDHYMYVRRLARYRASGQGKAIAPEHRLYGAMIGSIVLPIGLFWFAWTSRRDVHWISPILAMIPFACGNLLIFSAAALYLTDVYGPMNGASAVAANGLLRYVLGGSFPLFTVQMYKTLGIGWATSLLGFIAVALMPVPWVLFKYGAAIRQRSAYT